MNQKNAPPATKPENKPRRHIDCGRILYTAFLCMCMAAMLCLPASATTIWEKASEVMKDVYSQVLAISTIAAVVTAAVEQTESGLTLAVVNYKGFRVAIPLKEMMLHSGKLPNGQEYLEEMARLRRILMVRLGSEIDFVVKGHDNKSRSAVGSRKDAMLRKRQSFYLDKNELGEPMIYEGRVVQARVVAVSEKIIRVEVFGVECAIVARGLSRAWMGDATEKYSVGDRILVRVLKISGTTVEDLSITADVRSVSSGTNQDNLKKCVVQGRYAGRVTDIRGGVVFIRLNNGVNAIAHSCYDRRTPGKRDDVSFSVTRLDPEQGVAVGIITRIIKQNL